MLRWPGLLILLLLQTYAFSQDFTALMREGAQEEKKLNEAGALERYKQALHLQPANLQALNKCSELYSRVGFRLPGKAARDDYYRAAKTYAATALSLYPNDSEANCLMAIALGRTTLNSSGKEKIHAVREIKKYADNALRLNPANYKAWHVLGRWHYELSNLGLVERTAVKLFFGGMPKCSFKESVYAFEQARDLTSNFILNYFELARAYKKNGQQAAAVASLQKLLTLPDQTADDVQTKIQARRLLKSWQ